MAAPRDYATHYFPQAAGFVRECLDGMQLLNTVSRDDDDEGALAVQSEATQDPARMRPGVRYMHQCRVCSVNIEPDSVTALHHVHRNSVVTEELDLSTDRTHLSAALYRAYRKLNDRCAELEVPVSDNITQALDRAMEWVVEAKRHASSRIAASHQFNEIVNQVRRSAETVLGNAGSVFACEDATDVITGVAAGLAVEASGAKGVLGEDHVTPADSGTDRTDMPTSDGAHGDSQRQGAC
ncbi:hypothetical protein BWQ96_00903 [Gracilariopsis chorda]|uniref:Uncharacterized protein n=1 Tax=Gracilariopsis chorda TaxID=448386 RepID=A0A2V3J4M4_9FLOR|nr:hypothetical protein BWQ96_00903 [Gracilariopsis chorda]|eukprot:PXF49329.1 hypothetical protein BWQ96_00903 [Gracilariopsis chorda]